MSTLKDKNLKNNEEKKKKVKLEDREDGWDERFYLDKIPPYDAHKDINYLSLGFTKSKIRFEEKMKKEQQLQKTKKFFYSNKKPIKIQNDNLNKNSNNFTQTNNQNNKSKTSSNQIKYYNSLNENNNLSKTQNFKTTNNYNTESNFNNTQTNFNQTSKNNNTIKYKFTNNKIIINAKDKKEEEKKIKNDPLEKDDVIKEEIDSIKTLWINLGVNDKYKEDFLNYARKQNGKENIMKVLEKEKKQLKNFRNSLIKIQKEIDKRDNEIKKIKQLDQEYYFNKLDIEKERKEREKKKINEEEQKLKEKNMIDNNNNENPENEKEQKEEDEILESEKNKENILNNSISCLQKIRIHSVNIINGVNNFKEKNSYQLENGKINIDNVNKEYLYDKEYINNMKNDLDFLKYLYLNEEFNFKEEDPFLLNISEEDEEKKNNEEKKQYKIIPIDSNLKKEINQCQFLLIQEDLLNQIKEQNQEENNIDNNAYYTTFQNTDNYNNINYNETYKTYNSNVSNNSNINNNKPNDENINNYNTISVAQENNIAQELNNKKEKIPYPYKGNLAKKIEEFQYVDDYHKIFFNKNGLRRKLDKTKFHNLQAGFEKDDKKEKKEKIGDGEIPLMSSKSFINKLNEYDNFAEINEEDNETNVNMNESDYYSIGSDKEKKKSEQLKSEEEEK